MNKTRYASISFGLLVMWIMLSNSLLCSGIIALLLIILSLSMLTRFNIENAEYIYCTQSDKDQFIVGNKYRIISKENSWVSVKNENNFEVILLKFYEDDSTYYMDNHKRTIDCTFSRTNPNKQINNMPGRCSHGGFNGINPENQSKNKKPMSLLNKVMLTIVKIGIIIILIKVIFILIQQVPIIINNLLLSWKI